MIFSTIVSLRNKYFDNPKNVKTSKIPVISVGNISTGGTGKTPMCIFLCLFLQEKGYQPICIGRNMNPNTKKSTILSDATSPLSALLIGDELALIQKKCSIPILATNSKSKAALEFENFFLSKFENPVYVVDDGFQHRALHRTIDIVLVDDESINGRLLPFGRNREPLSSLKRATIVIYIEKNELQQKIQPYCDSIFVAKKVYDKQYLLQNIQEIHDFSFASSSCFIISSIAKPKVFREDVSKQGFTVKGYRDFKDHHLYSLDDLASITVEFYKSGADFLITTEKDAVKLENYSDFCTSLPILVCPQIIQFDDEQTFTNKLIEQLQQ